MKDLLVAVKYHRQAHPRQGRISVMNAMEIKIEQTLRGEFWQPQIARKEYVVDRRSIVIHVIQKRNQKCARAENSQEQRPALAVTIKREPESSENQRAIGAYFAQRLVLGPVLHEHAADGIGLDEALFKAPQQRFRQEKQERAHKLAQIQS